jgi:hypothetical protein
MAAYRTYQKEKVDTMELQFTKKQIEFMVYSLYLGSWVSCRESGESVLNKEIESLEQYVLGFAYTMKWFDWIDYDRSTSTYIIKPEREEELLSGVIDAYNEEIFWEELKSRLAERDLKKDVPESEMGKKGVAELFKLRIQQEDKYEKEFKEKGLERVQIPN